MEKKDIEIENKIFKTKTGFCHILPDKIILTREGIIGDIATVTTGNNITRVLIIYALFSIVLLYFAFVSFNNGQMGSLFFHGVLFVFNTFNIINSINNSATPVIYRNNINKIVIKKGISCLTRSRFEVFFTNEQGKLKKRLIMLPGTMNNGQNETEKAIKILKDEKLLNEK
jgi:hypothetical protein